MNEEKNWKKYPTIRFRKVVHQDIVKLAERLSEERGTQVTPPGAVSEAVKFFKENRPKVHIV